MKYHHTPAYHANKIQEQKPLMNIADMKRAVFAHFGWKCVDCGFGDARALQIDHINNDGHKDKSHNSRTWWQAILDSIQRSEGRYQLLCANCNWIKRAKNRESKQR